MGTSKQTVGIAMIGNGFAADFHTEAYKRVIGVEARLVGVYGPRPEGRGDFAKKHGYEKVYPSVDEALDDPDVDMVDACVPNKFHEDMVVRSLNAGKHAVIEKPFTGAFVPGQDDEGWRQCLKDGLESADRMIQAEQDSGRTIMYAENLIYAPGVQKARRLLDAADTPHTADRGRGVPQRHALALRHGVGHERRREPVQQGLPLAGGRPSPEVRGR